LSRVSNVRLAKEELERLISLCETIARTGADPYSVDVKAMLAKLRSILEKTKDMDVLVLDAETIYRIALLISLQHKWLKDRASSLLVDTQLVAVKVLSADKKSLAQALASCWRPIVSAENLTPWMIKRGWEHFLSLPTRNRASYAAETSAYDFPPQEALEIFGERKRMEEELKRLHREALERRNEDGLVDYASFVKSEVREKVWERAYLTAFLISDGYADLVKNPLTGEIYLKPYEERRERKKVASSVIVIKGDEVVR